MYARSVNNASDRLTAAAANLFGPIISLLFPQECGLCGELTSKPRFGYVCEQCWSKTALFDDNSPLCEKCGAFNSNTISMSSTMLCGRCDGHSFDSAFAIGPYRNALRNTILELKSTPYLPRFVIELTASRIASLATTDFDTIIPVPLSKQRQFERGFNQAGLIADLVSRITGITVDRNSLQRQKHTKMHRAGMDQKARQKTVENAFSIARPNMIAGRKVLLTDDVLTSGATVSACAKILKAYDAKSVAVFTIARADIRQN